MEPVLLFITIIQTLSLKAQTENMDTLGLNNNAYKFSAKKLIVPTVLVSYGVLSLTVDGLKTLNKSTRHETREHIVAGATIDNYMQYAPAVAVYGLNLAGVKGKHNFKDRTIIYATSQLVSAALVLPTKHLVHEERPDGSNNLSFPSGHTATAFSSAQFMFREYKDSNFWLSISGYPIAAMTGIYRVFNDKHWVGDVVAGAGIGILSTEMAYWLFPVTSKWFPSKNDRRAFSLVPFYQSKNIGLTIIKIF
jgi:membrane-associated phospholipid phosphatase